jgi:pilus assembly protein CpaE
MSALLLTPDDGFAERAERALGPSVDVERVPPDSLREDPRTSVPAILETYIGNGVDVVIIGPDVDPHLALDFAYEFDLQRPDLSVVLCAATSADILSEALHAGVRDVIDPLAAEARILDAYKRATEAAARSRSRIGAAEEHRSGEGRVIAVVSPKGGSGKTTVATNLAIGLARAAPGQVVIADMDLQFGDVATALQLMPEASLADAARTVAQLDTMSLKVLLTHHPQDLYALCAPESPVEAEHITARQSAEIVSVLRQAFKHVIIDTTAGLGEHTLAALEAATDVVLICPMDVPGVRSFRTTLVTLDEVGLTAAQRHVVLTRSDARVGLGIDDIERTIGRPVDVAVPSSRTVPLSLNQGTPLLESDQRRNTVVQALWQLTRRFADVPTKPATSQRRRRRRR